MKKVITWMAVVLVPLVVLAGAADDISQEDLLKRIAEKKEQLILDVRSEREFKKGHIPGALHIPYDQLPKRLDEVKAYKNKDVVIYCQSGGRAGIAAKTLKEAGFTNLLHLDGDWGAWSKKERPFEK